MQPKLSRAEYWLLELVKDAQFPLDVLGEGGFCHALYRPGHGLSREELIALLLQMFATGLIRAYEANCGEEGTPFVPTPEKIAAALEETRSCGTRRGIYYGLTEQGGALWEQFAFPAWQAYISQEQGELIGMRRDRVEEYLQGLHYMGIQVEAGTEIWDIVQPWQATYWKTLPHGHRVTFQATEQLDFDTDIWPYRHRMLSRWYDWGHW